MHNPLEQTNTGAKAYVDRLRRLPAELQPPYNWQEFQRRSQLHWGAAGPALNWRYMAAAAAVLLVIGGVAIWGRMGSHERPAVAESWETPNGATWETPTGATWETQHARAMESWLATLPKEPPVVRVGTRADVARLEDNIAQVDDLLTALRLGDERPDRLVALQRERASLVRSLAQVRYAEVLASESP